MPQSEPAAPTLDSAPPAVLVGLGYVLAVFLWPIFLVLAFLIAVLDGLAGGDGNVGIANLKDLNLALRLL